MEPKMHNSPGELQENLQDQKTQLVSLEKEFNKLILPMHDGYLIDFEMTEENYRSLSNIKEKFKRLPEQGGVALSEGDEEYRKYLLLDVYKELNKMESFYESNGNKWKE